MTNTRLRIPRIVHRWYARALGRFWAACPLCQQQFGGHEWLWSGSQLSSVPTPGRPYAGHAICPDCTRAGRGVPVSTQGRVGR